MSTILWLLCVNNPSLQATAPVKNDAEKVMPSILLCYHTSSEVDTGGMAVEVESFCQLLILFSGNKW